MVVPNSHICKSVDDIIELIIDHLRDFKYDFKKLKYEVNFVNHNNRPVSFTKNDEIGVIRISKSHVANIWSCALFCQVFYDATFKVYDRIAEPKFKDFVLARLDLDSAMDQYDRARDYTFNIKKPYPYELCGHKSSFDHATIISAAAILWSILHETGHGELDHALITVDEEIRREENEADDFATDNFIRVMPDKDGEFTFGSGLFVALISLFPLEPFKFSPQYPELYDRILRQFSRMDLDPNHHVYWMALRPLQLMIRTWEIDIPHEEEAKSLIDKLFEYVHILHNYLYR